MGDELELEIDGLGAAGDGVGRLPDGRVVFVPRALPGDLVRVRLGQTRKQVQYAELVTLSRASPDRVDSRCHAHACGGCGLKELAGAAQGSVKRRRVVETLRRIGGLDVEALLGPVEQAGDGWRNRHRVRLHAAWSGRRWRMGHHARHSHEVVELASCPVLWSELEQAVLDLGRVLEGLPGQAQLEEIEIAYSRRDGRAAAKLTGSGPMAVYKRWVADAAQAGFGGVAVETAGQSLWHGNLELRYDHARAREFDLRCEPGVFTQANPEMNDRLVAAVLRELAPQQGSHVLELHAGIGNFSVPLALRGAAVVAVERHRRASVLCRRNARGAGVEIAVRAESDAEAVRALAEFESVLLDPPRTGAREAATAMAASRNVKRVVYVSCDAATLARDAAVLVEGGFEVTAAHAFDMFPQTPHVEVMLALGR